MSHKKPGFILFLLFSLLSTCMIMVSLFFTQGAKYRQLMHIITLRSKTCSLAFSSINLCRSILKTTTQEEKTDQANKTKTDQEPESSEQKLLTQIFPYTRKFEQFTLTEKIDGLDVSLEILIQSEEGKLNINSLFDFEKKKFINEGATGDRKKICQWLFSKIALLTKKENLFDAFHKHLLNREYYFNDVTELLQIKEFAEIFQNAIFFNPNQKEKLFNLFLTDIFTVSTEFETINPWLFSSSWCAILDLKPKEKLNSEEQKNIFSKCKKNINWQQDWDKSIKDLYGKEYKDIAQEIKTILTTQFEANIFSLLLCTKIGETSSTVLAITKTKNQAKSKSIEVIKAYQI